MSARAMAVLVLALAAAGCRSFDPERRALTSSHPAVRTSTGVLFEDLLRGRGTPAEAGDALLLDYVVRLETGEVVDSTIDRGVPVLVVLGEAFVRGLDDGLIGMASGGRRKITVPPELAYGDAGVPGLVPPRSTLLFEVHAIEVRPKRP
ncbi:MAG: FKBP-type peptidyl-prolyl cis-trans isomerase [Planctomycetes bacterium]|nr:FKBP-type peptidyl-prolyl cis-trans isomerase [Planctomycetota bacterium]